MDNITLPFILSGPILRRTECEAVCIWLVTNSEIRIEAEIHKLQTFRSQNQPTPPSNIQTQSHQQTIKAGKQLFVHLLTITPIEKTFPTDTLLGYNLHFVSENCIQDLNSLGLLDPTCNQSIVYGELPFPSFFIKNSQSEKSNILYGSCRKPHGDGDDMLAKADSVIDEHHLDVTRRPDSLFLMGDQIYSDDVADPLFGLIQKLTPLLIGSEPALDVIDERLQLPSLKTALQQTNGRQYIAEYLCKFTSSHAHNHLIKWSEFALMYMLVLGPQLWESANEHQLNDDFEEARKKGSIYFVYPSPSKEHDEERLRLQDRFESQQEALIDFQQNLYKVRRLLANIPVYMIFDDHDITDDWNLSHEWKKDVSDSVLGKHVVANGLSAYWMFQGWGNDPSAFGNHFFKTMKNYHESPGSLLFRNDWTALLWEFNHWHYIAPTNPAAVFLDTRTQRHYDWDPRPLTLLGKIDQTVQSPRLLTAQAWEKVQQSLFQAGFKRNQPLIIASPSPVYGLGLLETVVDEYVFPLSTLGIELQNTLDFEAWKYNIKGFTKFLQQMANWNPEPCIILSGDVHSASSVNAIVQFENGKLLQIHQFTSSPIKNVSYTGASGILMKVLLKLNENSRKDRIIQRYCTKDYEIIQNGPPASKLRWSDIITYHSFDDGSLIETRNNLGLLTFSKKGSVRNRLLR